MTPKSRCPERYSPRRLAALLAVVALLGQSCTDRIPTAGGPDPVPVRITVFAVGTPISTLVVEVTATDFTSPLVFNLTVAMGVASGTIRIPPGLARTIRVTAFDDAGNVTHEGSVTLDVRPGQNPPVNLPLTPRSGQVPIVVTFGNFSVVVTPPEVTIDVGVTNQFQLTVSVTGADGQPVANPQVSWATTQPTVATVSTSGLVTGLANGAVTIVATFEGVAGLSAIKVTGIGLPTPTMLLPNPLTITAGVTGTLTATLSSTPTAAGTVSVSSVNPGVATVPASVAFAIGQSGVVVPVTAVAAGNTQITVLLNGGSASSTVQVSTMSLLPESLTIPAGSSGTLTVTIGSAAEETGTVVLLAIAPSTVGVVPNTVTIAAGQTSASFNVTAGLLPGMGEITASLNNSSASSTVFVTP